MINASGTVGVAATTPLARYFAPSGLSARAVRWQLEHPRLAPATLADLSTHDEQRETATSRERLHRNGSRKCLIWTDCSTEVRIITCM
jgi:hypothetical protein